MKVTSTSFWSQEDASPRSRAEKLPSLGKSSLIIETLEVPWTGWRTSNSPKSTNRSRLRTASQTLPSFTQTLRPYTQKSPAKSRRPLRRRAARSSVGSILDKIKHLRAEVKLILDTQHEAKQAKYDMILRQVMDEYDLNSVQAASPEINAYLNSFNREL